ncbi:hypothetical protein [Escherichia coli]|uniref:hypothetical protein n=1 Tax=Escherichia coli TaxID=562 RepID=UPI0018AD5F03|nr:hypothetical protein [Escherichia coli]
MMTLKHFLDRPLWAAAAGYDFNYMDCMSYTANAYDHSFSLLFNSLRILPETEVGELHLWLLGFIAAVVSIAVWPFIFWLVAVVVWFKCKTYRKKYFLGDGMTNIAKMNIEKWTNECEKKWKRELRNEK